MKNIISRRLFVKTAMATCAAPFAGCASFGGATVETDRNLSVFLSDIHVSGKNVKGQPTYQNPLFAKVVDQILAMNPRPARALIFGDIALWNGLSADYAESAPHIQRLKDAGIEVYLTTGNHDHREPLFRFHPKQKQITPVPGRFVSVVDVGTADFVLLDTLNETGAGEGKGNEVSGTLDSAQGEWLLQFAAEAKRPFFCGAHHSSRELKLHAKKFISCLEDNPNFAGYVHGHHHRWYKEWIHCTYYKNHVVRSVGLPSTGWWGNIGFATFRTSADRAELKLVQNDFFFPAPLKPGQKRPVEWDQIMSETASEAPCTFMYGR